MEPVSATTIVTIIGGIVGLAFAFVGVIHAWDAFAFKGKTIELDEE